MNRYRRYWYVLGVILLVVLIAVGARIGGDRSAYGGVRDLVAELRRAGVACDQLHVSGPNPTEDVVEFGACQIDGRTVNLHVYKNELGLQEHVDGNIRVRGQNPNYFTSSVNGANWVVDTYSVETSRRVQEALGGEIR